MCAEGKSVDRYLSKVVNAAMYTEMSAAAKAKGANHKPDMFHWRGLANECLEAAQTLRPVCKTCEAKACYTVRTADGKECEPFWWCPACKLEIADKELTGGN